MYVGFIVIAAVVIACETLAEETKLNDVTSGKRAPMGFQGMRGKKDSLSDFENDEFSKRALMGFQGMRGKKDSLDSDTLNNIIQDDFEKRAPMGFQGMRGKKDSLTLPELEEALYHEEYDKRAPMGFQGMRGKKTIINDDYLKRAVMGFQGMRGKKMINEFADEFDKRMSMGFQGMRGKKYYQDDYQDDYEERPLEIDLDGFRDKRYEYESEYKRAPMGFQGMRGKRSFENEKSRTVRGAVVPNRDFQYYSIHPSPGQIGPGFFVAMKGKRSISDLGNHGESYNNALPMVNQGASYIDDAIQFEKRSPRGAFGMRGRRIPRWEMRGKFIGVRGKRFSSVDNKNLMNDVFDNIERIQSETGSTTKLDNQ